MVEHRQVRAQQQAQFGQAEVVNGMVADALQPAHDVVGQVADQPTQQRRVARVARRRQRRLRRPQHLERLARRRHAGGGAPSVHTARPSRSVKVAEERTPTNE